MLALIVNVNMCLSMCSLYTVNINEAKHILIGFLTICIASLEKGIATSLAHLRVGVSNLSSYLNCKSSSCLTCKFYQISDSQILVFFYTLRLPLYLTDVNW